MKFTETTSTMEDGGNPCDGCKRLFDVLRSPFRDGGESSFETLDVVLHETPESFAAAVHAHCKLCNYISVSWLRELAHGNHVIQEDAGSLSARHAPFLKVCTRRFSHEPHPSDHVGVVFEYDARQTSSPTHRRVYQFESISSVSNPLSTEKGMDMSGEMQFLKRQLLNCLENHPQCRTDTEIAYVPTRLLHVGSEQNPDPRLCLTEGWVGTFRPKYAALSHCWGGRLASKLVESNLQQMQSSIPLSNLPKTFREAIYVTRQFGLEYLWIDALCIIQDSISDWQQEATKMVEVYSGSYFTIAATGAGNGTEGLFIDHQYPLDPHVIADIWHTKAGVYSGILIDHWFCPRFLDGEPLSRRAWAVQERYLSHRSFHFASTQVFWECNEQLACRNYPEGIPVNMRSRWTRGRKFSISRGSGDDLVPGDWAALVDHYSRCDLTRPDDKLVAISGMAAHFERTHYHCSYLAGLWARNLENDLMWFVIRGAGRRPPSYRAPSWSWASVDGAVSFSQHDMTRSAYLIDIAGFDVVSVSNDVRGQLTDGWIKMQGRLIEVLVDARANFSTAKELNGINAFDGRLSNLYERKIAEEARLHIEGGSLFSSEDRKLRLERLESSTYRWDYICRLLFDTADLARAFSPDHNSNSSVLFLPIELTVFPTGGGECQGLMLQRAPSGVAGEFVRIGIILTLERGWKEMDAMFGDLYTRLFRGELGFQRRDQASFGKQDIKLI